MSQRPVPIDEPGPERASERLDVDALDRYLRSTLPDLYEDPDARLTVRQFPGGHSNLTYGLEVGERRLVLRRPPFGPKIATAHDMGREHRILSGLIRVYDRVPRPLAHCSDEDVLGAPFYVMERIDGVILRGAAPEGVELEPRTMAGLSRALTDNLADIHGLDVAAAGLEELGRPAGYVERQVAGWTKRYAKARTDDLPDVERVAAWLDAHRPPESGAALIHNDYKYDNVMLDPSDLTRIVGVLDWEMATLGDPLMDLGTTLSLWVDPDDPEEIRSMPWGPTLLPGNLDRVGVVERYAERSGRPVDDPVFYFAFGLFKMAVVLQQIYKRYHDGHSSDERFAAMIGYVATLARVATLAIERNRIDRLG